MSRFASWVLCALILPLAVGAIAYGIMVVSPRDTLDRTVDKFISRPLLSEKPRSFESEFLDGIRKGIRDNPIGEIQRSTQRIRPNSPQRFGELLDKAYGYSALGPEVRTEEIYHQQAFEHFELTILRNVFAIGETEISWDTHHYRKSGSETAPGSPKRAVLFLPGAKAEMGAMIDRRQNDFMNLLPARTMAHADIWIVEPISDLWSAADANAKLTLLGRQLDGIRARATCEIARKLSQRYPDGVYLHGVRDGARIAEIVNVLCKVPFTLVIIDALPVPLEFHLAQRFLNLNINQIGMLQTVGPFWGLHSWQDFVAGARNPTLYFLTESDLNVSRTWLRATNSKDRYANITFLRKSADFGNAEFAHIGRMFSGTLTNSNTAQKDKN
ncbi:MAG: hypothetical protein HOK54_25245 [Alphaproteobacteria bacterium]|nr:hypothetical protein [Alphaproteobacteria bacterium]